MSKLTGPGSKTQSIFIDRFIDTFGIEFTQICVDWYENQYSSIILHDAVVDCFKRPAPKSELKPEYFTDKVATLIDIINKNKFKKLDIPWNIMEGYFSLESERHIILDALAIVISQCPSIKTFTFPFSLTSWFTPHLLQEVDWDKVKLLNQLKSFANMNVTKLKLIVAGNYYETLFQALEDSKIEVLELTVRGASIDIINKVIPMISKTRVKKLIHEDISEISNKSLPDPVRLKIREAKQAINDNAQRLDKIEAVAHEAAMTLSDKLPDVLTQLTLNYFGQDNEILHGFNRSKTELSFDEFNLKAQIKKIHENLGFYDFLKKHMRGKSLHELLTNKIFSGQPRFRDDEYWNVDAFCITAELFIEDAEKFVLAGEPFPPLKEREELAITRFQSLSLNDSDSDDEHPVRKPLKRRA